MKKNKLASETKSSSSQPGAGRRSFIRKTGFAVTAAFASAAVGISKNKVDAANPLQGRVDRLSQQVGILEDANAIRDLHKTYESHLDNAMYEEIIGLFTEDAEVSYNGGVFKGRKGIRRLYVDHFGQGLTGKRIDPAPGLQPEQQEMIEVAADRKAAAGRFAYSIQVGTPISGESSLVDMARLQGQGIVKSWEGGVYEMAYVKEGDAWKIKRIDFRTTAQADYAPGRACARPLSMPRFSKTYPENSAGPDRLLKA